MRSTSQTISRPHRRPARAIEGVDPHPPTARPTLVATARTSPALALARAGKRRLGPRAARRRLPSCPVCTTRRKPQAACVHCLRVCERQSGAAARGGPERRLEGGGRAAPQVPCRQRHCPAPLFELRGVLSQLRAAGTLRLLWLWWATKDSYGGIAQSRSTGQWAGVCSASSRGHLPRCAPAPPTVPPESPRPFGHSARGSGPVTQAQPSGLRGRLSPRARAGVAQQVMGPRPTTGHPAIRGSLATDGPKM